MRNAKKVERNAQLVAAIMAGGLLPTVARAHGISKQVAYNIFRRAALSGAAGDIRAVAKRFKSIAREVGLPPTRSANEIVSARGGKMIGLPDRWGAMETARRLAKRAASPTGQGRVDAMRAMRDAGKTLEEVGAAFGVGRARAHQIINHTTTVSARERAKKKAPSWMPEAFQIPHNTQGEL